MMIDYQAIAALSVVIDTQSFQRAAEKLFITQSAVSQRIKSLENHYNEPVLIRTHPYRATALGLLLLGHYQRITLMEGALHDELYTYKENQRISIAISRDGLETWFINVIDGLKDLVPINLEVIADDQEVTLNYLQNGMVLACASSSSTNVVGCKSNLLGYLDYVLVATPAFKHKYFNQPDLSACLEEAPAIIFDTKDKLHTVYLKHFFNLNDSKVPYHMIPSVAGFRQFAIRGYACALIPEIDILDELKTEKLIKLFPEKPLEIPVYWHHWIIETERYRSFNELVIDVGKKTLRQP